MPSEAAVLPLASLVLDDVQALFSEPSDAVEHPLHHLGGVALPGLDLADDAHRVAGPVGPGDVAGELLVRDVGVVLEGAGGLDDVDAAALLAPASAVASSAAQTAGSSSAAK